MNRRQGDTEPETIQSPRVKRKVDKWLSGLSSGDLDKATTNDIFGKAGSLKPVKALVKDRRQWTQ